MRKNVRWILGPTAIPRIEIRGLLLKEKREKLVKKNDERKGRKKKEKKEKKKKKRKVQVEIKKTKISCRHGERHHM